MRASTFAWAMTGCLALGIVGCGGGSGPVYEVQQQQKGFLDLISQAVSAKSQADAKDACDKAMDKEGMSSQDKTSFQRLCSQCANGNWDTAKEQITTMRGSRR